MTRSFYYMKTRSRGKLYRFFLIMSAAASLFFLAGVLNTLALSRAAQEALSEHVAPQVLRFHVLANSDSREDQELKLEVRGLLLDSIYRGLTSGQESDPSSGLRPETGALSKETLKIYISGHSRELEQEAEAYMHSKGFPYNAVIRIESCYFPTKQYGDVSFPCGTYDAVRVLLGEGEGKNWWCVLYPPLCFSGVTSAGELPDDSKQELKNMLPEEDYLPLMAKRRIVFGDGGSAGLAPSQSDDGGKNFAENRDEEKREATVHVRLKLWDSLFKQ